MMLLLLNILLRPQSHKDQSQFYVSVSALLAHFFFKAVFKVWFAHSIYPELWGWPIMCRCTFLFFLASSVSFSNGSPPSNHFSHGLHLLVRAIFLTIYIYNAAAFSACSSITFLKNPVSLKKDFKVIKSCISFWQQSLAVGRRGSLLTLLIIITHFNLWTHLHNLAKFLTFSPQNSMSQLTTFSLNLVWIMSSMY